MSFRTLLIGPVLFAMVFGTACAQREMRAQARVLADAGVELERETAEFTAARTAVVKLRQRNLVERQQQIAEQGQFNARTLQFWKLARDPERDKQVALYDGLTAAAAASAAVQDRTYEWEESVLARSHALTIDRAALHRFVQQLLLLSNPPRFIEGARFYVEYGAIVGQQVDEGLKDVRSSIDAAASSAGGDGSSSGGSRPTGPGDLRDPNVGGPSDPGDGNPPRGPDDRGPGLPQRGPTTPTPLKSAPP